jgi:hypothetical protein
MILVVIKHSHLSNVSAQTRPARNRAGRYHAALG